MSMRYQGSVVSATPPTITPASGLTPGGTAPGIWTLEQQFQARGAGLWPRTNGESIYVTAGTYTFVAPAGVTSVSVVCVGATLNWANNQIYGRGGGGLGYKNNITVVPGSSYTVVVSGSASGTGSYFIDTLTVLGGQGASGQTGGTFVGDGGGNGGTGGNGTPISGAKGAGGGGAGGYAGNGGDGGADGANNGSPAATGSGGGGGGAGATSENFGGGGGGVGLYGIGADGAGGVYDAAASWVLGGGEGGSGGARGAASNIGGAYGPAAYGGGFAGTGAAVGGGNYGGAVRIIYPGNLRTFPDQAGPTT